MSVTESPQRKRAQWLCAFAVCMPAMAYANDVSGVVLFVMLVAVCAVAFVLTLVAWFVLGRLGNATARAYLRMLVLAVLWTPVPFHNSAWHLPVLPSGAFFGLLPRLPASDTRMLATCVAIVSVLGATALLIRTLVNTRRVAARS